MLDINHDVSNFIDSYVSQASHPNIHGFFKDLIFALECNHGINNFFYIISSGADGEDKRPAFKRLADELESNFTKYNLYKVAAYYWVSLDFNKTLASNDFREVKDSVDRLVIAWDKLHSEHGDSKEKEWEGKVREEAEILLPKLLSSSGASHAMIQPLNIMGLDRDYPESLLECSVEGLYEILRVYALRNIIFG